MWPILIVTMVALVADILRCFFPEQQAALSHSTASSPKNEVASSQSSVHSTKKDVVQTVSVVVTNVPEDERTSLPFAASSKQLRKVVYGHFNCKSSVSYRVGCKSCAADPKHCVTDALHLEYEHLRLALDLQRAVNDPKKLAVLVSIMTPAEHG